MASKILTCKHMVTKNFRNLCKSCNLSKHQAYSSLPPLNEPLIIDTNDGNKVKQSRNITKSNDEVKITKLSNGLKVASENSFGQFSTIGGMRFYNF